MSSMVGMKDEMMPITKANVADMEELMADIAQKVA